MVQYQGHRFGAAYQAVILGAASGAEKGDIEQMQKIVPLIQCEVPLLSICPRFGFWCQCNGFGSWGPNLFCQTTNQSRATLWVRETCLIVGLRTFDNHLYYCLIVLKDIQHSIGIRMRCIWWNLINVCWNDVVLLDRDEVMHVWLDNCRRVSPWLSLGSICSVRYGMKYFNHQIRESESGNTVHT